MKKIFLTSVITIMVGLCIAICFKYNCTNRGIIDIHTIADIQVLNCNVTQMFTEEDVDLFIADAENYFRALPENIDIYIVSPTNNITQNDFTMIQEVKIDKVIRGESAQSENIQIVTTGGIYDQVYSYQKYTNDRPLFSGMINILLPDNQYLVFLDQLGINRYTAEKRYYLARPLFSTYNITSNYSIPIDEPVNTVAYNDFGNSEYLCDTQNTLDQLLAFKKNILDQYLND